MTYPDLSIKDNWNATAPASVDGFDRDVAKASLDGKGARVAERNIDGAATTGQKGGRFYNRTGRDITLTEVFVSAGTAPTGGPLTIDVHKNGTTVFSAQAERPSIAAGTNKASATPKVTGNPVVLGKDEYLTIEVDVVGTTVAGSDLRVEVRGA